MEDLNRMKACLFSLLILLLLSSPVLSEEKNLILVCDVENKSLTYFVDFEKGTVSGNPADISPAIIVFQSADDQITIDRYSGSITIFWKGGCGGGGCYYHGQCSAQQEKKF